MTAVIGVNPKFYFPSAEGGEVDVYIAGTTTRTNTWQDRAQTTLNENPVPLNARGECVLWLDRSVLYKFVVKDGQGATVYTVDNIAGAQPATVQDTTVVDRFSGTGAIATYTMSQTPASKNDTDVYVSGVYQQKNTYTVSGSSLIMTAASGSNNIEVNIRVLLEYTTLPGPSTETTNRALTAADNDKTLNCTAGITLTVPSGLPPGFSCAIVQASASAVTIAAGSGVTINNVSAHTKTASQYAVVGLVNNDTNTYILSGATGV